MFWRKPDLKFVPGGLCLILTMRIRYIEREATLSTVEDRRMGGDILWTAGHLESDLCVLLLFLRICARFFFMYTRYTAVCVWVLCVSFFTLFNPFRAAVPFWGQTTWILSGLSPKRDCGSRRVNRYFLPVGRIVDRYYGGGIVNTMVGPNIVITGDHS